MTKGSFLPLRIVSLQPLQVLKDNAEEERSETARLSSFVGAIAIGDLIKSTLGPKGMDKILQSTDMNAAVQVTNDGATILKAIGIDNPAGKILVDISRVQDDEVGDGTTSVTVLACELLREAEKLIGMKLHPQTIIAGWRKAVDTAAAALEKSATDNGNDPEKFKQDLFNIAHTTLSSKIVQQGREKFSNLCVKAVMRLKGKTDLHAIQIIKKKGGNMNDSYLDEGFLLDKKVGVNQPKRIENAKILIANTAMDTDKVKVFGSRVKVDSTAKIAELELAEKEKMKDKVDKIVKHECNVFINRQLIYNYPEQLFADAGVMAIEHADFEGVERLALVTGGEIVSTFDSPGKVKLGQCDLIEEIMIGEDRLIKFSGVALGEACTVVLRGATQQILDEVERSLHDALCVLSQTVKETRTVLGGGASEMLMANAVQELASKTPGKEAVAIEAFAAALRQLPTIIADNAGYDSAQLVSQLRAAHTQGQLTLGLDMKEGTVGDMRTLGVVESYKAKKQMLTSGAEAAEMILRVDDIIKCAPRQRTPDHH
ncbi:T-complex protein 1 subunit beta-like isoform X1 [Apostichopus japonicus]|uniref:T-complex protein 1 subunit beta-like isoform X1 n=1 Tax=Stichopus japonicus TaxID=307972 RepID=UPI003AB34E21